MIPFEELMAKARRVESLDADFSHHLRNLLSDGGVLLQLIGLILEDRDGFANGVMATDFTLPNAPVIAAKQQGIVTGIDQVLARIYSVASQERTDESKVDVP